jgi:transcriptional regulator with XRE-family HTH domain
LSLFSKNLRFLRKRENLNQEQIAVLFHKKANTIGNWENQKSEPSLAELIRLGEYFKVTTQDLVHTDLESLSGSTGIVPRQMKEQRVKLYPAQEISNSIANEENPDAFWIILRELRALNQKVDLLVSDLNSTGLKRNSDKSYH